MNNRLDFIKDIDPEKKDLAVYFCAPEKLYPRPPSDYSPSELVNCPRCKEKMWLTIKKKRSIKEMKSIGKEILLLCFGCFEKEVRKNPEQYAEHFRIDL